MNIRIAEEKDFDDVKKITRETIMEIYPKYYPHGAVRFFAEHHSDENIMRDIRAGIVYLLISDEGSRRARLLLQTMRLTDSLSCHRSNAGDMESRSWIWQKKKYLLLMM